ncbi:GspH/FimT family pseudopilin [Sphingomonas sp. SUN039]|uniref:GspH/FimT family pseudopilin n=1 Tax=Sphingomonas sp. SUN039 TaxID=2937787 RepID=UPI0021644B3D|nr:GspH/FimT family pseudopilin [Sphingomonas sp. SUN039]UVO53917.1 GspH/FimT family pseudopilin [Sphingomonas sp. SUN039]
MPISATGNKRSLRDAGFTLIELMVVLVILGLASAAVVLAMPDPGGRVRDEGERLAARALAVRDDAILEGRSTRIVVESGGYTAERRLRGRWQPYGGKGFGTVAFPAGVAAATGETGRVVVTFDATGAVAEPAAIDLSKDAVRVRIDIPANGAVRVT